VWPKRPSPTWSPPDRLSMVVGSGVAWDFWRSLGSPRYVCAPMVDQSELAFRMLTRGMGVGLAYTPMLHARLFTEHEAYRSHTFDPELARRDRPLFAQLAGHDPAVLLEAGRLVQGKVDAVDINFGCPQAIARKGRYGAFLLDESDLAVSLVGALAQGLDVPVTAKVRLLPSLDASIRLYERMVDAGASVLCVHGRTKEQNKHRSGAADWSAVAAVVDAIDIPVIANGGISSLDDAHACLEVTGAAAVMSSEMLLENPALFCGNIDPSTGAYLDQTELARRYLAVCVAHPPPTLSHARSHIFKMLHGGLRQHPTQRERLLEARSIEHLAEVIDELERAGWTQPGFHTDDFDPMQSWYWRHRVSSSADDDGVASKDLKADTNVPTRAELEAVAFAKRERRAKERKRRNAQRRMGRGRQRGNKLIAGEDDVHEFGASTTSKAVA